MNLSPQRNPSEDTQSRKDLACSNPSNNQNYETLLRLRREVRSFSPAVSPEVKMAAKKRLTAVSFRGGGSLSETQEETPTGNNSDAVFATHHDIAPVTPRTNPQAVDYSQDDEHSLSPHEVAAQHLQERWKESATDDVPEARRSRRTSSVPKNIGSQLRPDRFSDNLLTDELARPDDDDDDDDTLSIFSGSDDSRESTNSRTARIGEDRIKRTKPDKKKSRPKHKSRRPLPMSSDGPASRNAELYKRLQIFDWSASTLTLETDMSQPSATPGNEGKSNKKKTKKSKHHKSKKDRKMASSCSASRDLSTATTVATEPSTPSEPRRKKLPSIRDSHVHLGDDPIQYTPSRFNDSIQSTQSAPGGIEGMISPRNTGKLKKKKKKKKSSSSVSSSSLKSIHHSPRRRKKRSKSDKAKSIKIIEEDEGEDEDDEDEKDSVVDNTDRFWQSEPAVGFADRREAFCCSGRDRTQRISNKSSEQGT
eukprot:CAMPEP_0194049448 /NCGR_PEP_ID=MMETSP0009_2-20130614/30682_1 /TAXON_ID=210454 /ORGANISM="Grammatophora oceanica, Strain CCMP 410" /LENGTH=477 /DNA_ID=CAMNT_0038695609 /DNA_START=213 /DNA_END=1646 /DNA_ORIENTATION=-